MALTQVNWPKHTWPWPKRTCCDIDAEHSKCSLERGVAAKAHRYPAYRNLGVECLKTRATSKCFGNKGHSAIKWCYVNFSGIDLDTCLQVCQLRPYLDQDGLANVVHAVVTLRLDDCNVICVGPPLDLIQKLHLAVGSAWFKALVLIYRALNNFGPGCPKDHPYIQAWSSEIIQRSFVVPYASDVCPGSARSWALSVASPMLCGTVLQQRLVTGTSLPLAFQVSLEVLLMRTGLLQLFNFLFLTGQSS